MKNKITKGNDDSVAENKTVKNLIGRREFIKDSVISGTVIGLMGSLSCAKRANNSNTRLVVYTLSQKETAGSYDESMVVAQPQRTTILVLMRALPVI